MPDKELAGVRSLRVTRKQQRPSAGGKQRTDFGPVDKFFRLDRTALKDCVDLANDDDKQLLTAGN